MLAVQEGRGNCSDEELGAVGIRTSILNMVLSATELAENDQNTNLEEVLDLPPLTKGQAVHASS